MILTILRAEIAAKYGAPVYSRHPPITAIFPEKEKKYTIKAESESRKCIIGIVIKKERPANVQHEFLFLRKRLTKHLTMIH